MNIITHAMRKQKVPVTLAVLVDLVFLGIVFIWSRYLAQLIDWVIAGNAMTRDMIITFVLVLASYIACNGLSAFMANFTCEHINFSLRQEYYGRTASRDFEYFREVGAGQGTSVILNELNAVTGFISDNLFFLFDSAVKFVGTFAWFLVLNPVLAIATNLPCVGILIYVSATSKVLKQYTVQQNEAKAKLNGVTEALMNLFPVIRLYTADRMIFSKYAEANSNWEQTTTDSEKKKALLMSLSAIMTTVPLILTILIGGWFIINERMTIGELYIFINLSNNVSGVLMNMPAFIMQLRVFTANVKKLEGGDGK